MGTPEMVDVLAAALLQKEAEGLEGTTRSLKADRPQGTQMAVVLKRWRLPATGVFRAPGTHQRKAPRGESSSERPVAEGTERGRRCPNGRRHHAGNDETQRWGDPEMGRPRDGKAEEGNRPKRGPRWGPVRKWGLA